MEIGEWCQIVFYEIFALKNVEMFMCIMLYCNDSPSMHLLGLSRDVASLATPRLVCRFIGFYFVFIFFLASYFTLVGLG